MLCATVFVNAMPAMLVERELFLLSPSLWHSTTQHLSASCVHFKETDVLDGLGRLGHKGLVGVKDENTIMLCKVHKNTYGGFSA